MQVKKFEASTMREALEMVKTHLGPDAIILSAKGNQKSFGLLGKGSVEVTAAVSENTLKKKKFAEAKLSENEKRKFAQASARRQKEFIENAFEEFISEKENEQKKRKPTTKVPYVDITDEGERMESGAVGKNVKTLLSKILHDELMNESASSDDLMDQHAKRIRHVQRAEPAAKPIERPQVKEESQIKQLTEEIGRLKGVIENYQQSASSPMSFHPGANWGISYELSFLFEKLVSIGISEDNAVELVQAAQKSLTPVQIRDRSLVEAWLYRNLLDFINVSKDPFYGRVHSFVGNTGQGKTSALIKFASHLVINKKLNIAILTADNLKIGAAEQLKILAKILNVPFGVLRSQGDWEQYLQRFKNIDCILVDFPGLPLKNPQELQLARQYLPPKTVSSTVHYVQSATCRDSEAFEMGRRYTPLAFNDVIFTCVDESFHHGIFYNFQKKFAVPIHSLGIGPKIPEDYEIAIKERVLDLMFNLTKQE